MKQTWIYVAFILAAFSVGAQGTFQYDQQSVTTEVVPAGIETPIQTQQPIGQSFTPGLSSVDIIRLYMDDQTPGGVGSTVSIDLWSGSIGGALLGSSDAVFVPQGFFGYDNFLFSTPISVTPGITYYFQPIVQSGDSDNNMRTGLTSGSSYANGTAFINGSPSGFDLLFREGIVVPEPSFFSFGILGLAAMYPVLRRPPNSNRRTH